MSNINYLFNEVPYTMTFEMFDEDDRILFKRQ